MYIYIYIYVYIYVLKTTQFNSYFFNLIYVFSFSIICSIPQKITMGSESDQLRIFFFPLPAPGHMIPMIDEARLFAKRGVDVTIIITQGNASFIQKIIDREFEAGHKIRTHILQFPSAQVGLPDGIENYNTITSMNMGVPLFQGLGLLQKPIEQLLHEIRPDCIVSDMFYPWTLDVANKLGIPRLGFRGMSHISMCAEHCIKIHEPHKSAESNVVLLPGLPHKIKMLISQLPDWSITTNDFTPLMDAVVDSEQRSYGMLMNSFHELENDYEQYFKTSMGLKAWSVGPVSLWVNRDFTHKAERHKIACEYGEEHEIIDWLDSKQDNSVLYVGFGSLTMFPATQLKEIAHGLEASGHPFIWVIRKKETDEYKQVFPKGFEERMRGSKRGFIIKGWAPQMVILDHPATGGFLTHCGWNSILEGINAGLPMITWPLFAEQFFNEKLVTDVVRVGVSLGLKEWRQWGYEGTEVVKRQEVEKAVRLLMGDGEEAAEMRKRVSELKDAANKAVEIGGSSQTNLMDLINELKALKIRN
ncbi:soyasapogenol B glucuronide galactosyltransferase [Ziziphus jujuba]|uniref:Glycosyltransferase n=1 Tax=Ziziphus jujuba TaxID=326968 RepID=A0ABM3ISW9_ZIZJJ|nr:soyasapogenol B glucuronide galactosyltransferase [Ziziphus jujuba]